MTDLRKNIDHYMDMKGIKTYVQLLYKVALVLGFKGQDAYDFATREKSNFTKMLNGERPLKYEYIIPLEEIFGVSLFKMKNEDSYKLPLDKELIPFVKGFRYYAYIDDEKLYKKELSKLTDKEGKSILYNLDEYGKTFLDYVVEYNAINGVRFLRDSFKLKLRTYNNQFETEPKGFFWVNKNPVGLCRMIANSNDLQLFNDIFDPYYMCVMNGFYLDLTLYSQDDFFEIVMDHEYLFKDLFNVKHYDCKLGPVARRNRKMDSISLNSINPVINGCLNYALKHLDKYREQAIEILNFGIRHNERIRQQYPEYLIVDEIGGVRDLSMQDVKDIVIKVDADSVNDKEINELISKLPTFQRMR